MRKTLIFVSLVCLLAATPAAAQIYETVGIRAQGMGGAFVALADDATATWWNPAGVASGPFFNALVEYDRLRATREDKVLGVAVAYPALGVSYYHVPINHLRVPATSPTAPRSQ